MQHDQPSALSQDSTVFSSPVTERTPRDEFINRATQCVDKQFDERLPNAAIFRLLRNAIRVFAEHDLDPQWWVLLELTGKQQFDSTTDLLHFVPPAIRDQMINVLAQPEAH